MEEAKEKQKERNKRGGEKMKNNGKRKYQKGITLIALVITIIVLLILAGVSIATLTGENGILTKANQAREDTNREGSREKIELAVMASYDENGNFNSDKFKEEIKKYGGEIVSENEDTIVVEVDGYEARVDAKTGEILSIDKHGVTPVIDYALYDADKKPLDETSESESQDAFLTVILTNRDKLGTVKKITVIGEEEATAEEQNELVGENGEVSYKVKRGSKYTITVEAETEGVSKKAEKTVTIRPEPEFWKITTEDDSEWYDYGATVNAPKLVGDMTPIKYVGETQEGNKWANAITADGSMWVWIPRYAYKITEGYHTKTAGTIKVAFLRENNNDFLNGEEGQLETAPTKITYKDGNSGEQQQWLVHPAFTGVPENGGWKTDVTGIWVAKFDATGNETNLSVKPGKTPFVSKNINEFFKLAQSAKFGEADMVTLNSHMAKNSEWGAIAYLAQSQYGTKGQKVEKNDQLITGGSSTKTTIYTTNAKQSTTHNATGVYDMSGGAYEFVASYVNNENSNLETYGGKTEGDLYGAADGDERSKSTEYKTVYKKGELYNQKNDYEASKGKKGDAIYETSNGCSAHADAWHDAYTCYPYSSSPFFGRGGVYASSGTGLYSF